MNTTGEIIEPCVEPVEMNSKAMPVPAHQTDSSQELSKQDIKRNMILLILLDAIFSMGWAEISIALQPLLTYLKASNSMIGLITGTAVLGLPGIFLSPWISRRFRHKKWLMFIAHVPYLGALGVLGAGVLLSTRLGISSPSLLNFVFILMVAHMFFAGFVAVPHQEYTAACIPMSFRGRYSGFSIASGGVLSMASAALGGILLLKLPKPMVYGCLLLMTWSICQSGYILALFARELPTPIEKSPPAWSKTMIYAALGDKSFMKCVILMMMTWILFVPFQTFLGIYALNDLKMLPAKIAIIAMVMSAARVGGAGMIGIFIDKISPKRAVPFFMLLACLSLIVPLFIRNEYGVYVSVGFLALFLAGVASGFNALIFGIPKPENRAGNFAVQIIGFYIAGSLGPLFVGRICDLLTFRTVFGLFAVVAFLFFVVSRRVLASLSDDARAYS